MTKILRIDYSPYILESKYHPNSKTNDIKREGCLLRFLFKDIGFGYADCHPLQEFGDSPVNEQLTLLKEKRFTFLTQRSSYFAKLDATFRNDHISAFEHMDGEFPKNHYTAPAFLKKEDILERKKEGFEKFKFKFGRHLPNEVNYLRDNANFFKDNQVKVRIDYNGNLKQKNILNELKEFKDIIEFIEDPFSKINESNYSLLCEYSAYFDFATDFVYFDPALKKSTPMKIEADEKIFTYKIVKPARENFQKLKFKSPKKLIFTSSMDHPFGQICALYDACLNKTKEHCGLITHYAFETNPYSDQLIIKHAQLLPTEGTGFGFDSLLKSENWKKCFRV